jgi:GNAT superfamily N-acetyltransferase
MIRDLLAHVSREDLRLRFFDSIREFSPQFIAGLIDAFGVTAFVAFDEASSEMLGVVWLHFDELRETGEYAILLRSDFKGRGLGWHLMQLIIEYAKAEGLSRIDGQILPGKFWHAENVPGTGLRSQDGRRGSRRVQRQAYSRRLLIKQRSNCEAQLVDASCK